MGMIVMVMPAAFMGMCMAVFMLAMSLGRRVLALRLGLAAPALPAVGMSFARLLLVMVGGRTLLFGGTTAARARS